MVFGVPEEIALDQGSTLVSHATEGFLQNWGVKQRISSAHFPNSNSRAELGVKAMKRLLRDNIGPKGHLDADKFRRALLACRNTPM